MIHQCHLCPHQTQLLAKSLILGLPSPISLSRKVFPGLFLRATCRENSSLTASRKHLGLDCLAPTLFTWRNFSAKERCAGNVLALPQFCPPALIWSSLASSEMLTTYPPPLRLLQKKISDLGVQSAFGAMFCCFLAL